MADPNEPETAAVHVPAKCVGYILGHRGASIQAMTEKTGATLRVAPANEVTTGSSEHRVRFWVGWWVGSCYVCVPLCMYLILLHLTP